MPTCFIICPFGENGTETRVNADDLRDLIIRPALEPYGFHIERGDDHLEHACKLLHEFDDPRLNDFLETLSEVNPIKAKLLRSEWKI